MKKKNYLLVLGLTGLMATTGLTSCMDNEEPAGISDLRSAKAEFIAAKTSYELTQVELQKLELQMKAFDITLKEIAVQKEQLQLELSQDSTALNKAKIAAEMLKLEEKTKEEILGLQKSTLATQEAYEKAKVDLELALLTYRDDEFEAKITPHQTSLDEANAALVVDLGQLLTAKKNVVDYDAKNVNFAVNAQADVTKDSVIHKIQSGLLADMMTLKDANADDFQEEVNEKKAALNALIAEVASMKEDLDVLKAATAPIEAQIAEQKVALATSTKSLIAKDDVTEGMGATMKNALFSYYSDYSHLSPANPANYFEDGMMTQDYPVVAQKQQIANHIHSIAGYINTALNRAYDNVFVIGQTSGENDITDAQVVRMKNELARLQLDIDILAAQNALDITAWVNAHKAYAAAVTAYDAYNETTPFTTLQKAVSDYDPSDVALDTDAKKLTAATGLMAKLKTYGLLRDKLDNAMNVYSPAGAKVKFYSLVVVADAATAFDSKTQIKLADFNNSYNSFALPYSSTWDKSATEGTVGDYLETCQVLFDASVSNITSTYAFEPTAYGKIPAGVDETENAGNGSYYALAAKQKANQIFKDIDAWRALVAELRASADGHEADVATINAAILALQESIKVENEKIYTQELAINWKDGDFHAGYFTSGNPYNNAVLTAEQSEKGVLEASITSLEGAVANGGMFYVTTYNENTGQYTTTEMNINYAISQQESTVLRVESDLISSRQELSNFIEFGFDNSQYRENLVAAQVGAQAEYDAKLAEINRLTIVISNLLAAYGTEPAE